MKTGNKPQTREGKQIISLAITGASGVQYGFRLLEMLLQEKHTVYLMVSKAAQVVIGMETDIKLPARCRDMQSFLVDRYGCDSGQLQVFGEDEWTAPPASGTGLVDAMVVCPCSMGALSAIATGASNNLIERAADVTDRLIMKLNGCMVHRMLPALTR